MSKKSFDKLNQRCVYQYTAGTTQMFLFIDGLDLDTPALKLCFEKYDRNEESGSRVKSKVDIYVPINKFLRMAEDVLSGRYLRQVREDPKKTLFELRGGSEAAGQLISRKILLIGDTYGKTTFAFYAEAVPGERGQNNIITPKKGAPRLSGIYLNIPDGDLKELMLIGRAYVQAFIQSDLERRLVAIRSYREGVS